MSVRRVVRRVMPVRRERWYHPRAFWLDGFGVGDSFEQKKRNDTDHAAAAAAAASAAAPASAAAIASPILRRRLPPTACDAGYANSSHNSDRMGGCVEVVRGVWRAGWRAMESASVRWTFVALYL